MNIPLAFFQDTVPAGSPLLNGLTSYYTMSNLNDSVGSYTLSSFNDLYPAPATSSTAKNGVSYVFNTGAFAAWSSYLFGNNSNCPTGPTNISSYFSISMWVRFNNVSNSATRRNIYEFSWGGSTDRSINLKWSPTQWSIWGANFGGALTYNFTSVTGVWYHIVMVNELNVMKFYLNGSLVMNRTCTPYPAQSLPYTFVLGNDVDRAFEHQGWIDEVAIWRSTAITAADVTSLYNGGAGKYYPFN